MSITFSLELRQQRVRATDQLDWALRAGDDFLAEAAMARIEELDHLATHNDAEELRHAV